MKSLKFVLLVLSLIVTTPPPPDVRLELQPMGDQFWVVLDDLPAHIQPSMLHQVYQLLRASIQPHPDSPLIEYIDALPAVVRFVPSEPGGCFPNSAEGFAGLTALARWNCAASRSPQPPLRCALYAAAGDSDPDLLLAVVSLDPTLDDALLLATTVHELAHLAGAVDGSLCLTHPDYDPHAAPDNPPADACWWYGWRGIFTCEPCGLAWDALQGRCAASAAPSLCCRLAHILTS